MNFTLANETNDRLTVMLEPIGDSFEVHPARVAVIDIDIAQDSLRIEAHTGNFLAIWTERDVKVSVGGKHLHFPPI